MNSDISLFLGRDRGRGTDRFLSVDERARHIYTIGRTGSGKTTFLRSLALQDIRLGRGVCVIDPHGELAESLADSIPRARLNDTVYFDAGDREHPIGFNPLEPLSGDGDAEVIASDIVAMLKGLFAESWGEWLEYLLKHVVMTLVLQKDVPVTLVGVQRMLQDRDYREGMVARTRDPVLRSFWVDTYGEFSRREEVDRASSTLNKSGKFALSLVLRNIFGQWRSGFDLQSIMDEQKILIVNLAKGKIGDDNARLLGAALVSRIVSTALRRAHQAPADRVPFYLHVDEFQTVTNQRFAAVVSEARKYQLSLSVAHQNFDQIDPHLVKQIMKESATLCAFKVSFEDNERLASAFHPINPHNLSTSSDGEFYLNCGDGAPRPMRGPHPDELDALKAQSLERVVRNSRYRYSRPRWSVERDFNRWYAG